MKLEKTVFKFHKYNRNTLFINSAKPKEAYLHKEKVIALCHRLKIA